MNAPQPRALSRTVSIRTRLVVGVVLLYALLVGLFVLDIVQRQQRFLHGEQVDDALSLGKGIAQAGTPAILANDVIGVQEVLAAVVGNRELHYGFVVDDDGKVLAHTDRALVGKYVADPVSLELRDQPPQPRILVDDHGIIDAAAPIVEGGRRVGWVRIGLGQEHMRQAMGDVIRNGLVYAALAIILGALFAAWVGRQLTSSLYSLLQVAEATRDGERQRRATVAGNDEIGALARAFNAMLDRLADSESGLRRLNEELEHRVAARTADLTEANEEVRKSETLFRGLLESSADAIVLVNERGEIVLTNAECARVFGYERHELLGRPVEILIPARFAGHAELRDSYRQRPGIRPMGVGRPVLGKRKDGSEFPAEVRLSPLRTEDGMIVSAIVRDVTERQQAEDRLRDSERRYRLLLENLPHRIFSKDRHSVFQAVNPAFAQLLGYGAEEIVGKSDYDFYDAARAAHIQELDREVLDSGRHLEFDEEFVKDGETRIYHTMKAPVLDDEDKVIGLLGISWDITDRKRAENALAEASRDAEAANQAKSDFLANMSHEIRTPMNAVIGLAHLLGQTGLDDRQRDYLDKIGRSANALLALLNSILDLSKVEAGKLELEERPFRLDELMRDLATILSANAQHKDIEVLFKIDPQLPVELVGDSLRLNQVLINLAGNAIKFTDHGEVVIAVSPVSITDERIVLRFSIRDTGIGIAPEQRQHLFQAFSQADSSTSRRFGGSGLGLAICSRLVQLMGGELDFTSEAGHGSDFHFTAGFGRAPETAPAAPVPRAVPGKLRVLVVDDNPTAREVMDALVASFGWQADVVGSGAEALALVEQEGPPYDVIFLDWKMPGMDGLETSRRIREATRNGPPPVIIVVTAYGRELLNRQTSANEVDAMLVKPVTASLLMDAVTDAFGATAASPEAPPPVIAHQPLAGLRLLVAEDNAINRQVVSEMLHQAGASVVLANNGVEAVACFERQGELFDAVLMDLQMPEMDGYAATAALRALHVGAGMPIIAMTANAMAADRERCLAAGMNDHVAKPLSPEVLVRTLCKWTRGRADEAWPAPVAVTGHPPIGGIDVDGTLLRLGGKVDTFHNLLQLVLRQLPATIDACVEAVVGGQPTEVRARAHAVSGMAANVGATALAAVAARLEAAGLAADATPWAGLLADLQQAAADVLAGIATAAAGWPTTVATGKADEAALAELGRLIDDDNFDAVPAFDAVRPGLTAALGEAAVTPLALAIETFDFTTARRLFAELRQRQDGAPENLP